MLFRSVLERNHAARGRAPEAALPWPENAPGADVVVRPHDLSTYDDLAPKGDAAKPDDDEPKDRNPEPEGDDR